MPIDSEYLPPPHPLLVLGRDKEKIYDHQNSKDMGQTQASYEELLTFLTETTHKFNNSSRRDTRVPLVPQIKSLDPIMFDWGGGVYSYPPSL